MRKDVSSHRSCSVVEILEGRTLASFSPSLAGSGTFPTHTTLTVDAGQLGQPITFNVTVFATGTPPTAEIYSRGKLLQEVYPTYRDLTRSPYPRFPVANEAT